MILIEKYSLTFFNKTITRKKHRNGEKDGKVQPNDARKLEKAKNIYN